MLKEPLLKIQSLIHHEGRIDAELQVDRHSEILAVHFPGQPVVPGACMLQIVKEILADTLKTELRLVRADNIKFLSLVEPSVSILQLNITYKQTDNDFRVTASLFNGETTYMKLQGIFTLR
ncbi:hypothetical protein [Mucilaginibacter sp. dw_454]|uniref:hypothetical protein n=1 Tax=Mucilaginibacter sp. dw_454 TaxID=2720079 RepID=UPI001BD3AB0D|nr:hypothetical protein [Mucilaginibacter sp. dw_454]